MRPVGSMMAPRPGHPAQLTAPSYLLRNVIVFLLVSACSSKDAYAVGFAYAACRRSAGLPIQPSSQDQDSQTDLAPRF